MKIVHAIVDAEGQKKLNDHLSRFGHNGDLACEIWTKDRACKKLGIASIEDGSVYRYIQGRMKETLMRMDYRGSLIGWDSNIIYKLLPR